MEDKKKKLKCWDCGTEFDELAEEATHLANGLDQIQWKCPNCGKILGGIRIYSLPEETKKDDAEVL